jgi:L-lactate dehydrogenase complex protein LldG
MSSKEDILKKYKANVREKFDMPDLSDIKAITYPEPLVQFVKITEMVGGQVIEVDPGRDINVLIRELFPDAKEIASNLPEITIATRNPDTVGRARDLNGTDVGVIRGKFGVAENACIWIPQQTKEKSVCFAVQQLVIVLRRDAIVNNMHEAYRLISDSKEYFKKYPFGTFISGPSKTADIESALVYGAQAARGVTVVLK